MTVEEILAIPPVVRDPAPTPAERLALLMTQADALMGVRPECQPLRDACCIVRGYCGLYPAYKDGEFPWGYLHEIVQWMGAVAGDQNHVRPLHERPLPPVIHGGPCQPPAPV